MPKLIQISKMLRDNKIPTWEKCKILNESKLNMDEIQTLLENDDLTSACFQSIANLDILNYHRTLVTNKFGSDYYYDLKQQFELFNTVYDIRMGRYQD